MCPEYIRGEKWKEWSWTVRGFAEKDARGTFTCVDCDRNPGLNSCLSCCDEVNVIGDTSSDSSSLLYGVYTYNSTDYEERKIYKKSSDAELCLFYSGKKWRIASCDRIGTGRS